MLYWDRETQSFWSQMTGECVVGPSTGKKLKWIPTEVTTWAKWRARHPKSTVLAPVWDKKRYRGAYRSYHRRGKPIARFLGNKVTYPKTYKAFDLCTIIRVNGKGRCYPHPALPEGETKDGAFTVVKTGDHVVVKDATGKLVPAVQGYWFSFFAFYEGGTVWAPTKKKG